MTSGDELTKRPQYRILTDATRWMNVSPEARQAAERDAIATVLDRVPPEHRGLMRSVLTGEGFPSGANASIEAVFDPEMARLLGVIRSIRAAERPIEAPPNTPPDRGDNQSADR
jgi:hypothetical protein